MPDDVHVGLRVRKLADRTGDQLEDGTWPFAGLQIVGDPPPLAKIPTSFVDTGTREGWLTAEGSTVVAKPGGPPADPWRAENIHVFRHATRLVLHTIDGDVAYLVTRQPDKYEADGTPVDATDPVAAVGDPTRTVDFFYLAELEA